MPKRSQTDGKEGPETPSKRPRRQVAHISEPDDHAQPACCLNSLSTPEKRIGSSPRKQKVTPASGGRSSGSATPKPDGKTLFATPRRAAKRGALDTPSKKRADQSAKRKSASLLAVGLTEDDWDGEQALAEAILEAEEEDADCPPTEEEDPATIEAAATPTPTPKRGRGRPKGSRNKRSPTPEGDIAPEEKYFFQNRTGPAHLSNNLFSSVKLLTHDEYFEQAKLFKAKHGHMMEKEHLMKLHQRSFPQWSFELNEGYSICLYGYGSKRLLTTRFAWWLHSMSTKLTAATRRIVIVNGYTAKLSIRTILNTLASAVAAANHDDSFKLSGPPQEMLDTLLAYLSSHQSAKPTTTVTTAASVTTASSVTTTTCSQPSLVVIVNSIDAPTLNKTGVQDVLARLASHHQVHVVVTADTPFFPLLWNSNYLDLFNFAFHDCTTFTPYDAAELPVVDQVYDLLGRKGRRMGGKEGIKYVLKSLPPNAQNLYRILLGEILSILLNDQGTPPGNAEPDEDEEDHHHHHHHHDHDDGYGQVDGDLSVHKKTRHGVADEEVGIEYRLLYQKASEEFVASSDMNFRFLLKEFHDHQMITSRRDASGTELLCVPLGREEMQAVLEDLIVS